MIRLSSTALVAALVLGGASRAEAQTADVSGSWTLEVTTDQGTTTPSMTLEQDGESLTGHYSSETLGEAEVTGTVSGSSVTISFSADAQGQQIPVVYSGTIDENGELSGSIDLAGGLLTGSFRARRSG